MKRSLGTLEPWSTKEKLCLCVAVMRSGDQNWMSVSRQLRVFGEKDRPPEWYSQKQCAQQYEALLSNVNTSKRKKRSEKGVEREDTPAESIVRKMLEERLDELQLIMEQERKEYAKIKQEMEDIESGRADDRLDEFEREMEEELEREAARASILRQHEERSKLEVARVLDNNQEQPETKVPTSPLLTSLLQSPSSYRGSMHNLLHPPPSVSRVNDSPTLSRLLESPAKQIEPTALFPGPSSVKKEPVEMEPSQTPKPVEEVQLVSEKFPEETEVEKPTPIELKLEDLEKDKLNKNNVEEKQLEIVEEIAATQVEEIEVEVHALEESNPVSVSTIKEEDADGEKEDLSNMQESSFNTLQDSDTMEEQQSITELDRQMVNMIVAGTGVISVSHDTSSEHLEEISSSEIHVKESSTADDSLEELKTEDVDLGTEDVNMEVGEEMVNLGGAVVVEEEADTTVHEVEVLEVSELDSAKSLEEDDEAEVKAETPETDQQDSQEEVQALTPKPSTELKIKEEKDEAEFSKKDTPSGFMLTSKNIAEVKPESPCIVEEDSEGAKRPSKKRLISGSVCSDSKPSSPACHLIDDSKEYRAWKKSIMLVFNRMASHKYASMFLRPITNEQAPAYDTVIQKPVDLSTIKKRIESGELRTTVEFQRELLLMFQNAIMYNNNRTLVYEMASVMKKECMQHIELMVEAMGEGVPWRKDSSVNVNKLHTRGRGEAPKRKRTSTAAEDSKFVTAPKIKKEVL